MNLPQSSETEKLPQFRETEKTLLQLSFKHTHD